MHHHLTALLDTTQEKW